MKRKTSQEFDAFDKAMRGLLAVPYAELQEKIEQCQHVYLVRTP